jgi:hypothetical protein
MAQRSLHAFTKVYYRSMPCFSIVSWTNGPCLQCSGFPHKHSFLHHVVPAGHEVCHKVCCHFDSIEHETQPMAYLINKQVVPYQTHGSTCYLGVCTPRIQSLANSSTTCHDGINHLHHSNHCSNHTIEAHHGQLTSRWIEDHLSQRHKSTS